MNGVSTIRDREAIEEYLRVDGVTHLYEIGDLDDLYWPHTTWFAQRSTSGIESLALYYEGVSLPVLIAMEEQHPERLSSLLIQLRDQLPDRFYAHMSPGLEAALDDGRRRMVPHGLHERMVLSESAALDGIDTSSVRPVSPEDLEELRALYDRSYPGHWFEPVMLEAGHYYGVWEKDRLISAAGVHIFSSRYRVAALGNIATAPESRGRGHGTRVAAHLCRELLPHADLIGLNVKADNAGAIQCYQNLGFERRAVYGEFMVETEG